MQKFNLRLKTGYYFKITIFDSINLMHKYCNDTGFGAMVCPYTIENSETKAIKKCIGDVFFYKGNIGAGLMAHEMLHCALWHDRIVNKSDGSYGLECNDKEERLAYTLTELVAKLNKRLWKSGYYN